MKLNQYDTIYFLGIGGIGMSALARWFKFAGKRVAGYDRTPTALTNELMNEGIDIHFEDLIIHLPDQITPDNTLVVYTPAIPAKHLQLNYLKQQGFTIMKRSEALGLISNEFNTIAVAGTHGKTSTSSLIAHILKCAGKNMVAFLGGITTNYHSNLVMHGEINSETIVVVEADEFDRSFLRLHPDKAIITSADPDHLDIYGTHQEMKKSFTQFINQIHESGNLIIHDSIAHLADGVSSIVKETYGLSRGQFFACNITVKNGFFEFDFQGSALKINNIIPGVPGFHNVENAIAAIRLATLLDIPEEIIRSALASFKGVKRRFEYIINQPDLVFIDDYAHHPTEIEAFLKSVRTLYPEKKLTVIFQPHLYTRTRDFASGFSESLSLADEVLLMDIYPAREEPIKGVTSDIIFDDIKCPAKIRCTKQNLLALLQNKKLEVVTTVGAGDIDTFVQPISKMLTA